MPVSLEKDQPEDKPPAEKPQRVPAQLTGAAQKWAVALGALILGTGVVAVFVVNRDWGPVSLILIGAVLLLSGLTGRLPYVKWGDKEVDYSAYEKVIQVLESPPEERPGRLEELARSVPPSLAPQVSHLVQYAELMRVVRESLPRHVSMSEMFTSGGMEADGVLTDSTGKKLIVELKGSNLRGQAERLRQKIDHFRESDRQVVGGLLVHARQAPTRLVDELRTFGWEPVLVEDANDALRLEDVRGAIERAFTRRP